MSFPKKGRFLRGRKGEGDSFAAMVSSVLKGTLGDRPASIKLVARWTSANERTVKNWFAGSCAPRGHHFRDIVRHCPDMLDAFLASAGRQDRLAFTHIGQAREGLLRALAALDWMAEQDGNATP